MHCYFVSAIIYMQNTIYWKQKWSKMYFGKLSEIQIFLFLLPVALSIPFLVFNRCFCISAQWDDAMLHTVSYSAIIQNQATTKVLSFFFFFLSFFFMAALECAVVQMWQVFQMESNCMWIQNSSTLVDHVLIIWFSKCALGYACSECVYLPSFTAICTASFTFFFARMTVFAFGLLWLLLDFFSAQ